MSSRGVDRNAATQALLEVVCSQVEASTLGLPPMWATQDHHRATLHLPKVTAAMAT